MMNTEGNNGNKPLGLWNVVSIGIGAMVGAGIFALLGQAALLMEASTWVAFAFGGIVAMFSGYAYARLGAGRTPVLLWEILEISSYPSKN